MLGTKFRYRARRFQRCAIQWVRRGDLELAVFYLGVAQGLLQALEWGTAHDQKRHALAWKIVRAAQKAETDRGVARRGRAQAAA